MAEITSDTYTLYMKGELYARLWDAYDKLEYTERMMYTDIATDHEYSSANTAHKKCEKALVKLKEAIKDLI